MEKQKFITTIDPENGQKLAEYPVHSPADVNKILGASLAAYREWKETGAGARTTLLSKLAISLAAEKKELVRLMRSEMGKPLAEGEAEVDKCIACAKYYIEKGGELLQPISVATEAKRSFVSFEPLGPVLAIMPWNFPLWQAIRCAVPSLRAGNPVLLKHASNVTGCALALERLFRNISEREHLFRTLILPGKEILALISRPEVAAVSLTGSTEVGRQVASAAGHALKKCVLELGGSDAYVILADANLAEAARICAQSRLLNAGQSCIAAKRFIVEKNVLLPFSELLVREMQARMFGPLARADLRAKLQAQVDASLKQGAELRCGGKIPAGPGFHYPATALASIRPGMTAFEEELFGPVAAITGAENEKDAIRLANHTSFGLGAAIFTSDLARAERIARYELEAGSCFGNALVRSDPRLPFGGIKDSGFGRELAGFGLREFTNIKSVYIEEAGAPGSSH